MRLPQCIWLAALTFVEERLADNPQRLSKALTGNLAGLHAARVGDYRILFRIDDEDRVVRVLRVAHRAHAYRPR